MTPKDSIPLLRNATPEPFQIDPNFEPMGQLDIRTYNQIVNRLFNLMLLSIHALQALDQEESAQAIAEQAHAILAQYDEDLAEMLRWQMTPAAPWKRKEEMDDA